MARRAAVSGIMFALAAHGVPASAASLSPFAHDAALREHGKQRASRQSNLIMI